MFYLEAIAECRGWFTLIFFTKGHRFYNCMRCRQTKTSQHLSRGTLSCALLLFSVRSAASEYSA